MTQPDPPRSDQSGTDQRRAGRSRNRRDEILSVAFDLFATHGYRGASLAAVAERAGLTQQGLLHYFPNKEALLVEVLRRSDEVDPGRMFTGPTEGATPLDHLADLVAYQITRPGAIQARAVLTAESLTDAHPARTFFVERYAEFRRGAAVTLGTGLDGRLPAGLSPDQAATLLIAVIEGLQLQWLLQPDEIDLPVLVTAFLTLLQKPAS
jgi:AcrR family transcriptional regulator